MHTDPHFTPTSFSNFALAMRLKGLATSEVLGASELNVGGATSLTSFDDVKKLDLVNEKMPARKGETLDGGAQGGARSSTSIQNYFRSSVVAQPPKLPPKKS